MNKNKILGIPCNLGANRSGIEFCIVELQQSFPKNFLEIDTISIERQKEDFTQHTMKYKNTIFHTCKKIAEWTKKTKEKGYRPICIGGDHSLSMGSIGGISKKNMGIIWIDAHGDMNTDKITESGNIHGMSLAILLGHGDDDYVNQFSNNRVIDVRNVVVLGARDLDKKEEELMHKIGLKTICFHEIQKQGLDNILAQIKDHLKVDELHISFDIDSLDPSVAPGVSTPVPGGFTTQEAEHIFNFLYDHYDISSVDIVEFNPINDGNKKTAIIVNNLIELLKNK